MKIHSIIRSLAPVFFVLTLTALYHPLDAQKNQTTASAGAKEKRSAPAVKTPAKKAAPAVPAAPAVLRQGLEHLKSRNFSEARSAFKTAQKGASKDVKKQCRALKQVGRKYHKKYFRALNKCLQLQKSGDYKAGILAYNKAESKFRAINRRSVAALLKPVDDHLMKQHAADVKRLNEQRIQGTQKLT